MSISENISIAYVRGNETVRCDGARLSSPDIILSFRRLQCICVLLVAYNNRRYRSDYTVLTVTDLVNGEGGNLTHTESKPLNRSR